MTAVGSQTREQAYQRLDLPADGQEFLTRITAEFDKVARAAERGLASNRFADDPRWQTQAQKARRPADLAGAA